MFELFFEKETWLALFGVVVALALCLSWLYANARLKQVVEEEYLSFNRVDLAGCKSELQLISSEVKTVSGPETLFEKPQVHVSELLWEDTVNKLFKLQQMEASRKRQRLSTDFYWILDRTPRSDYVTLQSLNEKVSRRIYQLREEDRRVCQSTIKGFCRRLEKKRVTGVVRDRKRFLGR
jgi:hypothetical protein